MKYDLEKNAKRIKFMCPGYFETIMFFVSIFMMGLSMDLELEYFCNVNGAVFFMVLIHTCIWLIDSIIYCIIKKRREKSCKEK